MNRIRRPSRWMVALAVLALASASCQRADEAGGTVVFGLDQQPEILNSMVVGGDLLATAKVVAPVLYPLWRITPDFGYEPLLLDGEPETSGGDGGEPFTVTYRLKDGVTWSDGTPITAEDIVFTYEVIMNDDFDITTRAGYDEIESATIVDDRTVEFAFQRPYAPWRTLFSDSSAAILPAHALADEDFNTVWNDGIVNPKTGEPIASGPYVFDAWDDSGDITIVRNDNFWGEPAHIDRIVFRPFDDMDSLLQEFRGGDVHHMDPAPQIDLLEQMAGISAAEYDVANGPNLEMLWLNQDRAPLDRQYVRRAIAMAIDRQAIASELLGPIDPDIEPLNNAIFLRNAAEYEDHWSGVIGFDPDGAVALLEENGCVRADDGIFECDAERLEFAFVTAESPQRTLVFETMQSQLLDVGVQIDADFGTSPEVFLDRLFPQDYDMFMIGLRGGPDPVDGDTIWQCQETTGEQTQNYHGYCNPEVDVLMQQQLETVDPGERAALYNQADALIAQDVPVVPLYQVPVFQAWREITGPQVNATSWGPTWNAEEWQLTG